MIEIVLFSFNSAGFLVVFSRYFLIAGPREARNPNLDSDQRIASYACAPRL